MMLAKYFLKAHLSSLDLSEHSPSRTGPDDESFQSKFTKLTLCDWTLSISHLAKNKPLATWANLHQLWVFMGSIPNQSKPVPPMPAQVLSRWVRIWLTRLLKFAALHKFSHCPWQQPAPTSRIHEQTGPRWKHWCKEKLKLRRTLP